MNFRVRYARDARDDLKRLYAFLLERDETAAIRVPESMDKAAALLREFPFTCREANCTNPFLRELGISFGGSGYVALFEVVEVTDADAYCHLT